MVYNAIFSTILEGSDMRRLLALACLLGSCLLPLAPLAAPLAAPEATIVIFRHGEKPPAGLGMLSCRGLNRSLALPAKLSAMFGRPMAAFAPNPSARKSDRGADFDYNRPLLTLGPSAVAAGIPISDEIAWDDAQGLASALLSPELAGKTVYVAWEHHLALKAVGLMMASSSSDASALPKAWADDDFDTLYILRVSRRADGSASIRFEASREGLDGALSEACPG